MLSEAYGREAMKKASVFEWHKLSKSSRVEVTDVKCVVHFEFIPQGQTVN
jgi:hypothetical protein